MLIQVDLGREETKTGIAESGVRELAGAVRKSSHLRLLGLMTLPPFFDDPEKVRPFFRRLRELRDELRRDKFFDENEGELSMGMTNDYEVAIEEGATIVRVGTAIFGTREKLD